MTHQCQGGGGGGGGGDVSGGGSVKWGIGGGGGRQSKMINASHQPSACSLNMMATKMMLEQ